MVKDFSIVFRMESGEKVKVSAYLNEPKPTYYPGTIGSRDRIEWAPPCRWEARPSIPDDVTQGAINIERIGD